MRDERMSNGKFEKSKNLDLRRASLGDLSVGELVAPEDKPEKEAYSSVVDSKELSKSLTKAQNQLGLCLQRQRQVGFILREVKEILKR